TNTYVVGIHKKGQVAGFYDNGGFLDDHGTYTTINPPGSGPGTVVTGINSKGELVGYFTESSGGGGQGFLYNGGAYTVVDFPGASLTHPAGINDKGQIVGIYMDNTGHDHGFIDDHGQYMTIDPPGSGLGAASINANGQIVGEGFGADAFLANPVPSNVNAQGTVTITSVLIAAPNNTLTGSAGNNTFTFNPGFGNVTVTDFNVSQDSLR